MEDIIIDELYNPEDYYDTEESDFIQMNKDKFIKSEVEELDDIEIPKKKRVRRSKEEIEKEKIYLDDKYITSLILRDIHNKKLSDELAEAFLVIQKRILMKPNFSGYYGEIKENMLSDGMFLFLKNWYKFKPYRVRNNYIKKTEAKFYYDSKHKSNTIYINKYVKKFDMISVMNRTYTVNKCKKIKVGNNIYYEVKLFNKLKCSIKKNEKILIYKPKTNLFDYENREINGGFSFLSLFVFTSAKNVITASKNKEQKIKNHLEIINSDISSNLSYDIF